MRHSRRKKRRNSKTGKKRVFSGIILKAAFAAAIIIIFVCCRNVYLFSSEAVTDIEDSYPVKGVDVSSYQGDIDWRGLEKEGVRFAFIKATEGSSHVDKNFKNNWKKARRTGMKVGAYHFLSYDSPGDAQAANFIDTAGKRWGMMPPVVDVEFYGKYLTENPSKETMYEVLDAFIEKAEEKYGKTPIIYTNLSVYEKYISGRYDEHPIWISSPDDIPDKLPDGREWLFCQYTFTGTSPSVEDGNRHIDYNVFNGSKWEFRKYDGK